MPERKPSRVKRPELEQTPQQSLAHAAADGIATDHPGAHVTIGCEQVTVRLPGEGLFYVMVYRG